MQKILVVSVALTVVAAGFAFADDDGADRLNAAPAQCLYVFDVAQKPAGQAYSFHCCRPCRSDRLHVPPRQWLSTSEIIQKLAIQGYLVHEIEVDGGSYEFEATNAAGARIEGHAHPATGEVYLPVFCCSSCLAI